MLVFAATSERANRGPTRIDRAFQLAYVDAHRLMRVYWRIVRPAAHGALVSRWNQGEILLVRNAYVRDQSLPGGCVRGMETSRETALRELREEVGIDEQAEDLELVLDETNQWDAKRDHVAIFSLDVPERPVVAIDHREVVEAGWYSSERTLSLALFPQVRVIERRTTACRSVASLPSTNWHGVGEWFALASDALS